MNGSDKMWVRGTGVNRGLRLVPDKGFTDPHWKDLMLFYEYFHGDNRRGCGASHQTEWTALVAKLIQQSGELFAAPNRHCRPCEPHNSDTAIPVSVAVSDNE